MNGKRKTFRKNLNGNKLLNDKLNFFIDTVAKYCDKCGTPYSVKDLHIIQDSNVSSIIHFSCSNCKSRHVATFVQPLGISSRAPINTDLNVDEIREFANMREVSTDDILNIYMYLQESKKIKI